MEAGVVQRGYKDWNDPADDPGLQMIRMWRKKRSRKQETDVQSNADAAAAKLLQPSMGWHDVWLLTPLELLDFLNMFRLHLHHLLRHQPQPLQLHLVVQLLQELVKGKRKG